MAVTDNAFEVTRSPLHVEVVNAPPRFSATGPGPVFVDSTVTLSLSELSDPDGGAPPSVKWNVLLAPNPSSTYETEEEDVGEPGPGSHTFQFVPTTHLDFGDWIVEAVATDNEGTSTSHEFSFTIQNRRPELEIEAHPAKIAVGDPISLSVTDDTRDPDGGELFLEWTVLQAPSTSSVVAGSTHLGRSWVVPTSTADDAGSWVFEVRAHDDEEPEHWVTEQVAVLVDAPPTADVEGDTLWVVGDESTPNLVLAAVNAIDPDTDNPHSTAPGFGPTALSVGVQSYRWRVAYGPTGTGPAGEVLGVIDGDSTLSVPSQELAPGYWTFSLTVHDGEGNDAAVEHVVEVAGADADPVALIDGAGRYDLSDDPSGVGLTLFPVLLSGARSFDPDDSVGIDSPGAGPVGVGIDLHDWRLTPPIGCTWVAPEPGPNAAALVVYPAGVEVPSECHGAWGVTLEVTDNDTPPRLATATATLVLGACRGGICLDYPRSEFPALLEYTDNVDVPIGYRLDGELYDSGTIPPVIFQLDREFPTHIPAVFSIADSTVRPDDRAQPRVLWWHAIAGLVPPEPGIYGVRAALAGTTSTAHEPLSIWLGVSGVRLLTAGPLLVWRPNLVEGLSDIVLHYLVMSQSPVTHKILVVTELDTGFEQLVDFSGNGEGIAIAWDGRPSATSVDVLPPGHYDLTLIAFSGENVLGQSEPLRLVLFEVRGKSLAESEPPETGAPLLLSANLDDDDADGLSDIDDPAVAGDDEVVALSLLSEPSDIGHMLSFGGLPAHVRAWSDPTRTTLVPAGSPLPPTIYLEANGHGEASLRVGLLEPHGPGTATWGVRQLRSISMNVGEGPKRVARMAGAFDQYYDLRNSLNDCFVDLDPESFRVTAMGPGVSGSDTVAVSTETADGAVLDPENSVSLQPVSNLTVRTEPQLLVSQNVPGVEAPEDNDDTFNALANATDVSSAVSDESLDDRTHAGGATGFVGLVYRSDYKSSAVFRSPLCGAGPGTIRRTLRLQFHVLLESYLDEGIPGDVPATPGACGTQPGDGEGDNLFSFSDLNCDGRHDPGEPSEKFIDYSEFDTSSVSIDTEEIEHIISNYPNPPYTTGQAGAQRGPIFRPQDITDFSAKSLSRAELTFAPLCIVVTLHSSEVLRLEPGASMRVGSDTDAWLTESEAHELGIATIASSPEWIQSPDVMHVVITRRIVRSNGDGRYEYADGVNPITIPSCVRRNVIFVNGFSAPSRRTLAHEALHALGSGPGHVDGEKVQFAACDRVFSQESYKGPMFVMADGRYQYLGEPVSDMRIFGRRRISNDVYITVRPDLAGLVPDVSELLSP